jgi:hypothetical protein
LVTPFHGCQSQRGIQRVPSRFHQQDTAHASARIDVLWSLVQGVHESSVDRLVCLGFTVLVMQHSRAETHAPRKSFTFHERSPTDFPGHYFFVSPVWRIPKCAWPSSWFPKLCCTCLQARWWPEWALISPCIWCSWSSGQACCFSWEQRMLRGRENRFATHERYGGHQSESTSALRMLLQECSERNALRCYNVRT